MVERLRHDALPARCGFLTRLTCPALGLLY